MIFNYKLFRNFAVLTAFILTLAACGNRPSGEKQEAESSGFDEKFEELNNDNNEAVEALLVSPENPQPGQSFRVIVTGGKNILKAKIKVISRSGSLEPTNTRNSSGSPFWRIDEFTANSEENYQVTLEGNTTVSMNISIKSNSVPLLSGSVWKSRKSWDSKTEALYSAWINALFQNADERSSWKALHEVTQNKENNFLFNYLQLGEDDPAGNSHVIMQPDCADNPFYLRAYFAWKLGLPFGYHECDRGYLGKAPQTGRWITNEMQMTGGQTVRKFNSFLRMVMNGVHSGTARTALNNENSDYYPVQLSQAALCPGVVFADPYGHTLVLVGWIQQSRNNPGVLLSVDAQPDGTVGIKRFWKGNFLFTTSEVIGEPGFKAFRQIVSKDGKLSLLKSDEIIAESGLNPFSLQQKAMESSVFYHLMDRIINPNPLDPEMALLDLIKALHEQLIVRVTSVSNGEDYMKAHQGTIIPMPGRPAGVFQAGGQWEDFSTPNRDLRLLIAMDAVMDFPEKIVRSPDDFKLPALQSAEHVRKNLDELLEKKLSELSIKYTRTNGAEQILTLSEILKRKGAFEMAYNPNDGIEIRWGAPENSEERSSCRRHVPAGQLKTMTDVRQWFQKRLHPPT